MTVKIGILHPGEMGAAIAASVVASGQDVYWCAEGRSQATAERAKALGLTLLPSLQELCDTCDLLVSICPPHAAIDQARSVVACNFQGIYADFNAIAPSTAREIGHLLSTSGAGFVDGGIIGLPPVTSGTTWLYLSGSNAAKIGSFFEKGLFEVTILEDKIGQASGLKMCFAANSKGTAALHTAILGAAEAMGVRAQLEAQWDIYKPGFTTKSHERIRQVARKAWRFSGEMKEIAETLEDNDMPREFFDAAAKVYERQGSFKDIVEEPGIEEILEEVRKNL